MFLLPSLHGKKFTLKNDPTSPKIVWDLCGYDQHPSGNQLVLGITYDSVSHRTRTGSFKWNEVEFKGDIISTSTAMTS